MKKRRFTKAIPYKEYTVAYGHFDKSRKPIDRVVLHTSVSTRQGIINTFGGGSRKVSAHYAVDLDGSLLAFLEEYYTAYHAGNYAINQRSIGIEHIDNGKYNDPRPDVLYKTSAKLVADICKFYNIPCDRKHILKHNEVSATGCPHNLDVDRIVREAKRIINSDDIMAGDYYKGIDLNNKKSVKVCVDTWDDVVNKHKYVKKGEYIKIKNKYDDCKKSITSFDRRMRELDSEVDELKKEISNYKKYRTQLIKVADTLLIPEKKYKEDINVINNTLKKSIKELNDLKKSDELTDNRIEAIKKKAIVDCGKEKKDLATRMANDFDIQKAQYEKEIQDLKDKVKQKEVIVKKELNPPKDFFGRVIMALEVLRGRKV